MTTKNFQDLAQIAESLRSNKIKDTKNTLENVELNMIQRNMYRKLMYGIKDYTEEELKGLSPITITEIIINHNKAKKVLHILKAKKYYESETKLINSIFSHLKIGEKDSDWLTELPKEVTLRKLNISVKDIINEFINKRLLPSNFWKIGLTDNINL